MAALSTLMIRQNYESVLERIHRAAIRSNRAPDSVKLVVVTKTHPTEVVQAVLEAGARYVGENYVEEAVAKIQTMSKGFPVQWHMIGHIQRRKASLVCQYFQYIHSLDSLHLAQRLESISAQQGIILPALLECNLAGEETKFGFPIWQDAIWPELLPDIEQIVNLTHLHISGLMGMAPYFTEAELSRPYYHRLQSFQNYLRRAIPTVDWSELSMGMSGDFEVAIEEGATWVRIGQSILGPRPGSA